MYPHFSRFLIEGDEGAVLHTGDFRAEPCFLDSLKRSPFLQSYIAPPPETSPIVTKRLETIYLDTACLFVLEDPPAKNDAARDLIHLMGRYPPSTRFFLNCWTWGFEDIYKAIAHHFQSKVRVRPHSLLLCHINRFL